MILYPTLELMNGRAVSLRRGRIGEPVRWDVDPVEAAQGFAEAGASWMHVTDFDAMFGDEANREIVREIILRAGIPVQVSGGFRTEARIAEGRYVYNVIEYQKFSMHEYKRWCDGIESERRF